MEKVLKKKVLVLGSTGMLGHEVVYTFLGCDGYEVVDIAYRTPLRDETIICDITQKSLLEESIKKIAPDVIVNCVGVLIAGAHDNIANAIYINAYLPHQLKEIADEIGAKLVHISTDCVFSGLKGEYVETDEKDGKDTYAKTKALGEVIDETHVTLRTSIIGLELKKNGEGLFHWFMHQSGWINGYTQAIWSGVTTMQLAKAVKWAIENEITGLYHVTNNTSINKYELLKLFQKYTNKKIEIYPIDGKEVDKSFIDTRQELDYKIPDYDTMVREMIEIMKVRKDLYAQYLYD